MRDGELDYESRDGVELYHYCRRDWCGKYRKGKKAEKGRHNEIWFMRDEGGSNISYPDTVVLL